MKTKKAFTIASISAAILVWFFLFGLGLFISSQPFRLALQSGFNWKWFFITLITYTPTNVAFLCLASSFCGGCSKNLILLHVEGNLDDADQNDHNNSKVLVKQNPFTSMLRGFIIYIAFLSGIYIIMDDPFNSTSQQLYARAAGIISLLSYLVGYDNASFLNLIRL